jgi:hypothetical protein
MKVYRKNRNVDFVYPEDMAQILKHLNENGVVLVSASTIEDLYSEFSDEKYSAGWMSITEERLEEFSDWLDELDI